MIDAASETWHFKMLFLTFLTVYFIINSSSALPVENYAASTVDHPVVTIPLTVTSYTNDDEKHEINNLVQLLKDAESQSPEVRGMITSIATALANTYQRFINRQQQVLNLVYCQNCPQHPGYVQNVLEAMSKVPVVNWAVRSDFDPQLKPISIPSDELFPEQSAALGGVKKIMPYTFRNNYFKTVNDEKEPAFSPIVPTLRAPAFNHADRDWSTI